MCLLREAIVTKPMDQISWREIDTGAVITEPGNASCYHTGTWRSQRPKYDSNVCIRCWRCFVMCPDAAISPDFDKNVFSWNYDYCKGCGICAHECPVEAITMEED